VNNSSLNSLTSGPVVQFKVEDPTAVPDVTPDPAIPENDRRVRIGQAPRTVNFNLTGSRLRFARTVTPVTPGAVPVVNCEDLPNVPAPVSHIEVPCRFTIGANLQDLSADTTYEYRISDGNNARSDTFRIMVLSPRQISVDPINGDKRPDTPIAVTATNVEGVTVKTADEDPNWNVRVVPGTVTPGGFQIIITPKPDRPTDTERTVRVTFTNSDGTRSERREIQLVAAVATAVTPNPE
jgi:hypothetical protein